MDLDEVKACLRALLSSTAFSYSLNNLLGDFRGMTGYDLPLFGYPNHREFLSSLDDTVQLFGENKNPVIALVQSKKSAHITSLVDRQKKTAVRGKTPRFTVKERRLVVPNKTESSKSGSSSGLRSLQTPPRLLSSNPPRSSYSTGSYTTNGRSHAGSSTSFRYKSTSSPYTYSDELDFSGSKALPSYVSHDYRFSPSPEPTVETNRMPESKKTEGKVSGGNENSSKGEIGKKTKPNQGVEPEQCSINDRLKNKLKKVIQKHPKGLWCCEFALAFLKEYKYSLNFMELGYTSLIELLTQMPDVFRCVRPGEEDWILFDASTPPSEEEKKMLALQMTSNTEIRKNVKLLLKHITESTEESGIKLDQVPQLYKDLFNKKLDFHSLGFKNLSSLFESWDGVLLNLLRIDGKIIVTPMRSSSQNSECNDKNEKEKTEKNHKGSDNDHESEKIRTEADKLFTGLFPEEIVGPRERIAELDLSLHCAGGHIVKVCAAEVWSPSKFYVQLHKFKSQLNEFMDDIQNFYKTFLNKYKMPDSLIAPYQLCVGLYSADNDAPEEWHRAEILKVINDNVVLVNFVDYGTVTRLKKSQLRFLHRKFKSFPVQAFRAKLCGVIPLRDEPMWPTNVSKKFLDLLRNHDLDAEIIEIDFKKPLMSVVLYDSYDKPETNINERLVREKLAKLMDHVPPSLAKFRKEDELMSQESLGVNSSVDNTLTQITEPFLDLDHFVLPSVFHYEMKSLLGVEEIEENKINEKLNGKAEFDFETKSKDVPNVEPKPEDGLEIKPDTESEKKRVSKKKKREKEKRRKKKKSAEASSVVKESSSSQTILPNQVEKAKESTKESTKALPKTSAKKLPVEPVKESPDTSRSKLTKEVPKVLVTEPPKQSATEQPKKSQTEPVNQYPVKPPTKEQKELPKNPQVKYSEGQNSKIPSQPLGPTNMPKVLPSEIQPPEVIPSLEDVKKRINTLTLELISNNQSVKEVGTINPSLALKIASDMATAYVKSEIMAKLPAVGLNPANFPFNFPTQPPPKVPPGFGPVPALSPGSALGPGHVSGPSSGSSPVSGPAPGPGSVSGPGPVSYGNTFAARGSPGFLGSTFDGRGLPPGSVPSAHGPTFDGRGLTGSGPYGTNFNGRGPPCPTPGPGPGPYGSPFDGRGPTGPTSSPSSGPPSGPPGPPSGTGPYGTTFDGRGSSGPGPFGTNFDSRRPSCPTPAPGSYGATFDSRGPTGPTSSPSSGPPPGSVPNPYGSIPSSYDGRGPPAPTVPPGPASYGTPFDSRGPLCSPNASTPSPYGPNYDGRGPSGPPGPPPGPYGNSFEPRRPSTPFVPMSGAPGDMKQYEASSGWDPRCYDLTSSSSENSNEENFSNRPTSEDDVLVTQVKIGGRNIHLVFIKNEIYFEAEETVRTFTSYTSRETADLVLAMNKIPKPYILITKETNSSAYKAIKKSELVVISKSNMEFYLIPLPKVLTFIRAMGCKSTIVEKDIQDMLKIEQTTT